MGDAKFSLDGKMLVLDGAAFVLRGRSPDRTDCDTELGFRLALCAKCHFWQPEVLRCSLSGRVTGAYRGCRPWLPVHGRAEGVYGFWKRAGDGT